MSRWRPPIPRGALLLISKGNKMKYVIHESTEYLIRNEWRDIEIQTLIDIIKEGYTVDMVDYILDLDIRTKEGDSANNVIIDALMEMNHPSLSTEE